MSDRSLSCGRLKDRLIRLGSDRPDLQPHLKPVIDRIASDFEDPAEAHEYLNEQIADQADSEFETVLSHETEGPFRSYVVFGVQSDAPVRQVDVDRFERADIVGEIQTRLDEETGQWSFRARQGRAGGRYGHDWESWSGWNSLEDLSGLTPSRQDLDEAARRIVRTEFDQMI